jgi:putative ABC transport system permease protein
MLQNYFTVALRNLRRNKTYVLINALGMGVALACCMSAYLLIAYNIEFDSSIRDEVASKSLFKVMQHLEQSNGEQLQQLAVPIVMAPVVAQQMAGIKNFTRYCSTNGVVKSKDEFFSENISFADASLFELVKFPLKFGALRNFDDQYSVFISDKIRSKYFGEGDPTGRTLIVRINGTDTEVSIGGVFERIPLNSTFVPDVLLRIENYLNIYKIGPESWDAPHLASVLFELNKGTDPRLVAQELTKYCARLNVNSINVRSTYCELLPFDEQLSPNDVQLSYFHLAIPGKALIIFGFLAGVILLVSCFNLTNTTLAMTIRRHREIGVRKVVGSSRAQIVIQFFIEVIVMVALAIVAGLCMSMVVVPQFASMWGLEYGLMDLRGFNLVVAMILILFFCALLAGSYPAILNSRYNPASLFRQSGTNGPAPLTRVLLVLQFSLSIIVFVAGVIFIQNENYQHRLDFGYDKDQVLTISIEGKKEFETLRSAVQEYAYISKVSAARNSFGDFTSDHVPVKVDTFTISANVYEVAPDYFATMGLAMVSGRDFSDNIAADSLSVVVDENFISNHFLSEDPIGREVEYKGKVLTVIGVVRNHLNGLLDKRSKNHDHMFVRPSDTDYRLMVVRATDAKHLSEIQRLIRKEWKKVLPDRPFESKTQAHVVFEGASQYNQNLKTIFLFLTILGCLLSASGIYSLASLNVERRMKEIAIRKVLGSSVRSILFLVNKQFALILLVAMIVGGIAGALSTNALLTDLYTYHMAVSATTVLLCAFAVFLLGVLVTSGTIIKAANASPKDTLRNGQ